MTVAIIGTGRTFLDDFMEAFERLANMGMTSEEFLAAIKAAEDAILQGLPRSSISRPSFKEYKHQGPLAETRYGRPGESVGAFWLATFLERARWPPRLRMKKGRGCLGPQPSVCWVT